MASIIFRDFSQIAKIAKLSENNITGSFPRKQKLAQISRRFDLAVVEQRPAKVSPFSEYEFLL